MFCSSVTYITKMKTQRELVQEEKNMYFIYPFFDDNQTEWLLKIESFLKKKVPFVSAKFYEVEDDSVDMSNPNNELEQRYAHRYTHYYEKPFAELPDANWGMEFKKMHNESITKQ